MATEMIIKRHDTSPPVIITCMDGPNPVNLTDASAKFIMGTVSAQGQGTIKINEPATITDHINGVVQYDWVTGDTDTIQDYKAEIEVTWPSGAVQTFPASGYLTIKVVADIG